MEFGETKPLHANHFMASKMYVETVLRVNVGANFSSSCWKASKALLKKRERRRKEHFNHIINPGVVSSFYISARGTLQQPAARIIFKLEFKFSATKFKN